MDTHLLQLISYPTDYFVDFLMKNGKEFCSICVKNQEKLGILQLSIGTIFNHTFNGWEGSFGVIELRNFVLVQKAKYFWNKVQQEDHLNVHSFCLAPIYQEAYSISIILTEITPTNRLDFTHTCHYVRSPKFKRERENKRKEKKRKKLYIWPNLSGVKMVRALHSNSAHSLGLGP